MKAICCIKQVYDLDMILENDWIVDKNTNTVDIHYAKRIMNPFDETALEMMIRLKDSNPELQTEVLSIGDNTSKDILIKSLAVGAQKATRIDFSHSELSSPNETATLLYNQITNSNVDLVLCGKQSDLHNYSQTAQILAHKLGWACFTNVFSIKETTKGFTLKRLSNDNEEEITVKKPIVISVTQSENQYLRMATLRDMLKAKKMDIHVIPKELVKEQLQKCHIKYKEPLLRIDKTQKECEYLHEDEINTVYSKLSTLIKKHQEDVV